jgi:N-carbamoylsarcosine amidase
MGLWHEKIPVEVCVESSNLCEIDSRVAPVPGEQVLIKKRASAFHGTYLAGFLRAANVDTILVTGVTASGCVRQTICDGVAEGFRPIAVKEAIGDRIPGAVLWNLFDIDAKFGDVETVERCNQYLDSVGKAPQRSQATGRASAARR